MNLSRNHLTMPHSTTKQDGLFYSYTLPVEQVAKIDEFLSILEDSGVST